MNPELRRGISMFAEDGNISELELQNLSRPAERLLSLTLDDSKDPRYDKEKTLTSWSNEVLFERLGLTPEESSILEGAMVYLHIVELGEAWRDAQLMARNGAGERELFAFIVGGHFPERNPTKLRVKDDNSFIDVLERNEVFEDISTIVRFFLDES